MSSPEMAGEHPRNWGVGETALDVSTGLVGRVMGNVGPRYQLRPLNGAREWEAATRRAAPVLVRRTAEQFIHYKEAQP